MNYRISIARSVKNILLLAAAASVVTACSSSSSPPEPTVLTGKIVDTAVEGLSFSTDSQSGVTGADGEFQYIEGETVEFAIGALPIVEMPAKATINWFELGGLSTIPVGREAIDSLRYDEDDLDANGVYDGPSLSRAGAIAAVLVTLDEDRDSANGIVIAPAVAALMTADLDLTFDYSTSPRYSGDFKRLLRFAASEGLLSARAVRNGGLEIVALYERMQIDPEYRAYTRNVSDNDADGIGDRIRMLTRDANTGRVILDEYDNDNDGNLDLVVALEYGPELDSVFYTRDDGNDGVNLTREWTHDAFGDLIRYEQIQDGELYQLETRELDPLTGLYVRREVINPSRNIHTIETWTMDGEGNRPLATIDYDGDGSPEVVVTLRYDEPNSLWTYREDDLDGDGLAEKITTRAFNSAGNLLNERRDEDADGLFEWVRAREYDANGRLSRETIDTNNDGLFEGDRRWQRNSRGLTLSSRNENLGVLVYADAATYNAAGKRLTYSVDRDGDGSNEMSVVSIYDANNKLIDSRTDDGDDGTIDRLETRSYNANGQQVLRQRDDGADGSIENETRYVYDADGYITLQEYYRNGTLDRTSSYDNYTNLSIAAGL